MSENIVVDPIELASIRAKMEQEAMDLFITGTAEPAFSTYSDPMTSYQEAYARAMGVAETYFTKINYDVAKLGLGQGLIEQSDIFLATTMLNVTNALSNVFDKE
jgi:flagellin-like hook-associated protein FlgL